MLLAQLGQRGTCPLFSLISIASLLHERKPGIGVLHRTHSSSPQVMAASLKDYSYLALYITHGRLRECQLRLLGQTDLRLLIPPFPQTKSKLGVQVVKTWCPIVSNQSNCCCCCFFSIDLTPINHPYGIPFRNACVHSQPPDSAARFLGLYRNLSWGIQPLGRHPAATQQQQPPSGVYLYHRRPQRRSRRAAGKRPAEVPRIQRKRKTNTKNRVVLVEASLCSSGRFPLELRGSPPPSGKPSMGVHAHLKGSFCSNNIWCSLLRSRPHANTNNKPFLAACCCAGSSVASFWGTSANPFMLNLEYVQRKAYIILNKTTFCSQGFILEAPYFITCPNG